MFKMISSTILFLLLMCPSLYASAEDTSTSLIPPLQLSLNGWSLSGGTIKVIESDNRSADTKSKIRLVGQSAEVWDVFVLESVTTISGIDLSGYGVQYRKLCTTPCTFELTGSQVVFVEPNNNWSVPREVKATGQDQDFVIRGGSKGIRALAVTTGSISGLGLIGALSLLPAGYIIEGTSPSGSDVSSARWMTNAGWISLGVGVVSGILTYLVRDGGYTTIEPQP